MTKSRKIFTFFRYLKYQAKLKERRERQNYKSFCDSEKLKEELAFLNSFSSDTIYRLRYNGMKYEYISRAVEKLLGFTQEEITTIGLRNLIEETRLVSDEMEKIYSFEKLEENRELGNVAKWQADYLMRRKDGRKIWVSDISYPWFDKHGEVIGSVGCLSDITDRVEAEEQTKKKLSDLMNSDPLTGLANRRTFFATVEEELIRMKRSKNDLSILLIDIDNLRMINEEYGNDVGDKVIIDTSAIINECLRETDTSSRLGGEEFGVLLPETPIKGAYWVAERIRSKVSYKNITIGNKILPIGFTVSIGAAENKYNQEIDATSLYKIAEARLQNAKTSGKNQISADDVVNMS